MAIWDDILVIVIVIIAFLYILFKVGKEKDNQFYSYLGIMAAFHFLMTHVFYFYENGLDSFSYYLKAESDSKVDFNSSFISELTGVISKDYIDLSYYTTCLIFGLIGYIAFVLLYILLSGYSHRQHNKYLCAAVLMMFCLPSMHYWSSVLSKESIVMTLIVSSLYAVTNIKSRWLLFFLSIGIISLMRPHVSVILLISLIAAYIICAKINIKWKAIILAIGVIGLYFLIDWVMIRFNRPGISYASFIAMIHEWEESIRFTTTSDTNIVLQGKSYLYKLFTFSFRPLWQFSSLKLSVASIENIIVLVATISLFRKSFIKWIMCRKLEIIFSILAILSWYAFMCLVSSNYGYAMRQRSTFLPLLVYIVISFWTMNVLDDDSQLKV